MFEIFLFINPIGLYCYDIENKVEQTIDDLDIEACYHFVPIANVENVKDDIERRRCVSQKLQDLSFYTLTTNYALEAYHAIKIAYGNKKARKFLFELQQQLNRGTSSCSKDLSKKIMLQLNLNLEKIYSLLKSDYVKDSIKQDQKLASQWQIKKTPTTVIFDENNAKSSGVLLEGIFDREDLVQVLCPNQQAQIQKETFQNIFSTNHLRLI